MKDYSQARYFAISGIGYGKGFFPAEAIENYVGTQLRIPASQTVFKTKAKWEEALRSGDARAKVWKAPEGVTGFVLGYDGLRWEKDGKYDLLAEPSQQVCKVCGKTEEEDAEASTRHSDPTATGSHEFDA